MLSRYLIIVTIFLSSVTLALFLGNNIDTPSLVNGPAEADESALSSSSGSISNKTVDIPTISASKIKFSIYDNPDVGIKFLYPLGWEPVIKRGSDNSTIIEILFPNMTIDNNAGNFSSGHQHGPSTSFIVLSIEEEASNLSDDPNMIGTLNLLTKQNLALANQTLANFQLIKSYGTTFAGNPAHKIVYSFTEPSLVTPSEFVFQSMNIWTINGDKKYTISYSQPVEEYPTYLGIVQHMVDSFEITR